MKRLALLVGSSLIALMLVACGQGGQKKAEPQSQDMMQQEQAAPAAEQAAPAAEQAAPAADQAAPAAEENK